MATNIANLNVQLRANSRPLARDLDMAKARLKNFRDKAGGVLGAIGGGGGIGGAFSAIGGPFALAAGAVALLTHRLVAVSQAIDELGKQADRLGIATEALQSLQHAGDLAGVGAEELTVALDRFHRVIGDAATGSLSARSAFDDLGLSARHLAAQGLDRSFEDVAEALQRIPNRAERARLAFEIFGRQSARLDALLSGGRRGIEQARRELEAMGALSSRGQIRDVERMNDAVSTLSRGLRGGLERFAVEISPAVAGGVEQITSGVHLLSAALGELGRNAGDLLSALNQVSGLLSSLRGGLGNLSHLTQAGSFFSRRVGGPLGLPDVVNTLGDYITRPFVLFNALIERAFDPETQRTPSSNNVGYNPEFMQRLTGIQFPSLDQVNELLTGGTTTPISAQRDLARRALQEAGQLINSQRLSGAFQEGSSGAISAVNRFRIANSQQDRVVAAIQAGHRIQEQQRRELEDIRRILATGAFAQATF